MDRGNRIMAYFYGTPRNPGTQTNYDVRDMCYSIADFLEGSDWRTDAKATGSTGFNGSAGNYAHESNKWYLPHDISHWINNQWFSDFLQKTLCDRSNLWLYSEL